MVVIRPRRNESIPVTTEELTVINAVVDNSAGKWNAPEYIQGLFWAANASNNEWVFLRSEGWHQKEFYYGQWYKHVTLNYLNWTYHLYTKVKDNRDVITAATHKIDYISYMTGKDIINLSPTS